MPLTSRSARDKAGKVARKIEISEEKEPREKEEPEKEPPKSLPPEGSLLPIQFETLFRDITSKQRAEKALYENKERFRAIFDRAAIGIGRINTQDGTWIEVNQALCEMLGYSYEELSNTPWMRITHPDDVDGEYVKFKQISFGDLDTFTVEKRFRKPTGRYFWVRETLSLVLDDQAKPYYVIAVVENIDDRKRTEQELKVISQQRQLALDAAHLGWWQYDPITGIAKWDEGYKRIFGVEGYERLNDEILSQIIHPDDLPALWKKVEDALDPDDPKPFKAEYRIKRPDGAIRLIEAYGIASFEEEGTKRHATNFVGTVEDITDRKDYERKLANILESIGDGFFALDADWKYIYINSQAERSLGLKREQLMGKNHWEAFPNEVGSEQEAQFKRTMMGEKCDFEQEYKPSKRWFHNKCYPREGGGISVYFEDITDKKALSDDLLQMAQFPGENPNPILRIDNEGKVIYANEAADPILRMWRCRKGEIVHGGYLNDILEVFRTGKRFQHELDFEGKTYFIDLVPIQSRGYVNVYGRDITEGANAIRAMKKSEEMLVRSQEMAHLGSWELDMTKNLLTWSDEVYRIFGLTSGEFGATYEAFLDRVHPDDRAAVDSAYKSSVKENKEGYEIEHRVIRKDTGEIRVVQEKATHFRDVSGKIVRSIGMVHDISERKRAEEKLSESEERYRLAQAVAGIGTFEWDIKTGINTWTKELEMLYGLKPGEFGKTQKGWEDLILPEDRKHALDRVNQTLVTEESVEDEWRVVWPDGSVHWITGRFKAFKDETGEPVKLIGVNIDITRIKEIEASLRDSRERYRLLFENMTESFFIGEIILNDQGKAYDYRILELNPAYERNLGIGRKGIIGKTVREAFQNFSSEAIERFGVVVSQKKGIQFELESKIVKRYFDVHAFPLENNKFASLLLDITDRKMKEDELKESEERYRSIFTESHAVMLLVDPDTNQIVDANPSASRYYGYPHEELKGLKITDLDEVSAPEFYKDMQKESLGEKSIFTFKHKLATGEIRDVDVYTGSVNIKGKQLMHLIVFDVTEKFKAEQELNKRHLQWA